MYIKLLVDGSPSGDVILSNTVPEGYARWYPVEKPGDPNPIQEYVEGTPDGNATDGFYQTWTLQNKTFATDEEQTAANNLHTSLKWSEIRGQRNLLIAQTDWEVIKHKELGTTVPAAVTTYRQALRDITDQSDPFNITWPTKPDGYA